MKCFTIIYTLHLDSLLSLSPFPIILHASLRGNKVAPAPVPFFLSSPRERKGRLVKLRKGVDVAPFRCL